MNVTYIVVIIIIICFFFVFVFVVDGVVVDIEGLSFCLGLSFLSLINLKS